jgi:hypothetical protein
MTQTQLNLYGVDHDLRLFTSNPLKKAILEYLGGKPRALLVFGPEHVGDLALDLGKLLVWIASQVDDAHGPNFAADIELGERAGSVKALGEQFEEVGRKLLHTGPSRLEARVQYLQTRMAELEREVHGRFEMPAPPASREVATPEWLRITPKEERRRTAVELHMVRGGAR